MSLIHCSLSGFMYNDVLPIYNHEAEDVCALVTYSPLTASSLHEKMTLCLCIICCHLGQGLHCISWRQSIKFLLRIYAICMKGM